MLLVVSKEGGNRLLSKAEPDVSKCVEVDINCDATSQRLLFRTFLAILSGLESCATTLKAEHGSGMCPCVARERWCGTSRVAFRRRCSEGDRSTLSLHCTLLDILAVSLLHHGDTVQLRKTSGCVKT